MLNLIQSNEQEQEYPARLIRYIDLPDDLLSTFDETKNILRIDPMKASKMSPTLLNHLETSTLPATKLINGLIVSVEV